MLWRGGTPPSNSRVLQQHYMGINLRVRPVGPTQSEQSNRGLKRKVLDPCESLPDGKIHRLDDSGSMECDVVKLNSSGSVAPGNCGSMGAGGPLLHCR